MFQLCEWNDALGSVRLSFTDYATCADAEKAARAKVAGKRSFFKVSVHKADGPINREAALYIVAGDK